MNDNNKLENLVEDILDVLDLGNSDGGYGPTIYALEADKPSRMIQLQRIKELIEDYNTESIQDLIYEKYGK